MPLDSPPVLQVELTDPQFDFVEAAEPFPAFVGGFGSGKTYAGIQRALKLKFEYPGQNVAYYLPTYDLIAKIAFPRFAEILTEWQIPHRVLRQEKVIRIPDLGDVILRTMDDPALIIGYEVADSILDELDILKRDHAAEVWRKAIARNRQKKPDGAQNTMAVATTPEGFRFVYERWKKTPSPGYRLIQAPTSSNSHNLPANYIGDLSAAYPAAQLRAYLEGEFVNLASGTVYSSFDREANRTRDTIKPGDALHIGLDFNVGKMSAVVHVLRPEGPRAVLEYTGLLDTPAMISLIKARHEGHSVLVYPDASGQSRRSNQASASDVALLRQAGFKVCVNPANPAVKDRVLAVNKQFESGAYLVNPELCPVLVESLEQQAYDKQGDPDKTHGHDHVNDAAGYFIAYRFPIVRRSFNSQELVI